MLKVKTKFDAVITDCGLTENQNKEAQAFMKFDVLDSAGGKHQYTWFGNMKSEKATEFTIKTLVGAGFTGNDFTDLNKGLAAFDTSVKLTVELEHPQDSTGNVKTDKFRIKFINAKGGMTKLTGTVPSQVALFSRIKTELGVKKNKPAAAEPSW